MKKNIGYVVLDRCEDWEQPLTLREDKNLPPGGLLCWRDDKPLHVFADRKEAEKAIRRTEHYRMAFASSAWPEKRYCKIISVKLP